MLSAIATTLRRAALIALCALCLSSCGFFDNSERPNVLLIMLDDFGYNDLGANGNSAVHTPSLDRLARQGTHYTRHYAEASCSVARAAMMTGNYPAYYGFRPTHRGLSPDTPTIASVLRAAGYQTRHIGKWHVGNPTIEQSPAALGFDHWFGFLLQHELGGASPDGIHYPGPRYRNPFLREDDSEPRQYKGHLTELLTQRAIDFIKGEADRDEPWFLNLWYFAPHKPIQPDERYASQYADTGEGRYLAMLQQLDSAIGRVLGALYLSGQADDTLVIVVSDNGGNNESVASNHPFHGKKAEFYEGGVRTPLIMRWPGRVAAGASSSELVSLFDILPTIAAAADAEIPAQAIGRDLLSPQLGASPQLFWETNNSRHYTFSVLSRDGRWRYIRGSYFPETLNDLVADPSGATNVLHKHPRQAEILLEDYRSWRREQRRVELNLERLNERGGARITGSDVLRSPGSQGFTLAIGVTPTEMNADAQTIVHQPGRWGVYASSELTLVGLSGELITLPALPVGKCSELVVTTYHRFSPIWPDSNYFLVEVFVDGRRWARKEVENPVPNLLGLAAPTYLGRDANGGREFSGQLGRPLILNERVKLEDSSALLGDSVLDLPPLCL